MSLVPYVHVDEPLAGGEAGDRVALTDRDRHHLRTVLRLRVGDQVELADGRGAWAPAALDEAGACLTAPAVLTPAPAPRLTVAQALPKGRKLDEVVRALTELGTDGVVPVAAERSVARLADDKVDRAVARWEAIARAASEQARRAHRPTVVRPVATGALPERPGALLVAHPGAGVPSLPRVLARLGAVEEVTIAVGPEGGWSPTEVDRLVTAGATLAGLGRTVLRTEHAAAAAVAVGAAALGRWDD